MDINILKRIILENQEIIHKKNIISRNYNIPKTDNIIVFTGIRRCGKTYTLYENAKKYNIENILFLDFEDERLINLNFLDNYDIILDAYKSLFPDKTPVFFFDEIQNLKNWHFYLKRLHVADHKIYVTGSNANLISSEIATYLKGRSIEIRIYSFSFPEFLKLKNIKLTKTEYFTKQSLILNLFDEYLEYGSFPEVIKADKDDKRTIAKNIYNLLFYKDLVAKYDKNDYLLKLIVNKIAENITKEFSITSLSNKIISVFKTTVPTITNYFSILPEPFLTSNIYQYRTSFIARESRRKTYLADNSFILINRIMTDKSRLFENLIFNCLQRRYDNLFYYKTKNNKEVDFYFTHKNKEILIQASYNIDSSDTKNREVTAITTAMQELNIKKAFIFTYNTQVDLKIEDKTIQIVPFWQFVLNQFQII